MHRCIHLLGLFFFSVHSIRCWLKWAPQLFVFDSLCEKNGGKSFCVRVFFFFFSMVNMPLRCYTAIAIAHKMSTFGIGFNLIMGLCTTLWSITTLSCQQEKYFFRSIFRLAQILHSQIFVQIKRFQIFMFHCNIIIIFVIIQYALAIIFSLRSDVRLLRPVLLWFID